MKSVNPREEYIKFTESDTFPGEKKRLVEISVNCES